MIRTARAGDTGDAEFIALLAHQYDVFGNYVDVFQGMFVASPESFFICENDQGQAMGYAKIEWGQNSGDIQGVVVSPDFRRKGVATKLLDHIELVARERKIAHLKCITAETENPAALECFTQWGFQNEGFCGHYPQGQRAVLLRRTLN